MDVAGFLDHPFNLRDLFPEYGDDRALNGRLSKILRVHEGRLHRHRN